MLGLAIGADGQWQVGVATGLFLQRIDEGRQVAFGQDLVIQCEHTVGIDGEVQVLGLLVIGRRTGDRLRQLDAQLGFAGKGGGHDEKQQQDKHHVDQ
ncbi:hypothetical protein D3C73_1261690 [compost metagenome]